MMKGTSYLPDIERVVRDVREYKQQKLPIKVIIDKHSMLHIGGIPICKMEIIENEN